MRARSPALVFSLSLGVALAPALARADDAGADAKLAAARDAFEHGRYEESERLARALPASLVARSTVLRAEILAARGKRAEAIALLVPMKDQKGDVARRARLLLGTWLIETGKRQDAEEPLRKIVEEYNDGSVGDRDAVGLAEVGRAAFLLRSAKDANQAFNESERIDKKRVETLLWRAELFLDKYDPGHADEVTREALAIAPKDPDVLVMMARVKLDQTLDFGEAEKLVAAALAENPAHAGAHAVRAGLALRDMDLAKAEASVTEGLRHDPTNLELGSLRAAARFLDDDKDGFERATKDVLAKNPSYSRLYGIVGDYAEWEHRYDDIVTMMQAATKIDPDDAKAWAQLGLTMMRGGDEEHGLEALQKAWRKDKFNVRVFNTLNLYEKQIATSYETAEGGVFKVRYPKEEKAVLERYVPRMLGEAWASMKSRYGYVPTVPVQVELYGSREQFSVRTSGLPNIGIQGVCFGRVVAALSPKAEPSNWGNVLWHELGHVYAIQLSKNHVPRWFTEGLSEYETIARRPEWSRELDPELYRALVDAKLPGAVQMNRAFTHANDAGEMTVAYYASSQLMIFTVERFGMARVRRALELWGQGKKTEQVIREAFGMEATAYDDAFRAWALARLDRYRGQYLFTKKAKPLDEAEKGLAAAPKDEDARVVHILSLLAARKAEPAKKELAQLLKEKPGSADGHFVAAKLATAEKSFDDARGHLEAMRAAGHDGFVVQMLLAALAEAKDDKAHVRHHLEAAHRFDPSQSEPVRALFELAEEEGKKDEALAALRDLAALEQHDTKVWLTLLERLVAAKAWPEARKVGEASVYVDVFSGRMHMLYGRALAEEGAHERAVYELESAMVAGLSKEHEAEAKSLLAASKSALGRR